MAEDGKHEGGAGSLPAHKSGYGEKGQLPFEKGGGGGSTKGATGGSSKTSMYPKS